MAANTLPIYTRTADLQIGGQLPGGSGSGAGGALIGPTANTASDGTGVNTYCIYTADATEGSYVYKVILKPIGAATSTVAQTVGRIYYCSDNSGGAFSGGTTNTIAKTTMIAEVSLPAVTISATVAAPQFEVPINLPMPPKTLLLMTFGTATGASLGYNPLVVAGKY